MSDSKPFCPSCHSAAVDLFYEAAQVPTNSVLLLTSRREALDFPRADIRLGHCRGCGFIFNTAFDPGLTEYSGRYESTQGYSPTFNRFHERLARDLIDRFGLRGKQIVEIGCGSGEFLALLCDLGGNRGVGYDPAYDPDRHQPAVEGRYTFIRDFYSAKYRDGAADFIACKMTLEHIRDTAAFVAGVRQAIGKNRDAIVFFQVPNGRYVFGDLAFWDVYYEHCSYFSAGSLARLFRQERFDVVDLWTAYDDQYLMLAARPADRPAHDRPVKLAGEEDLAAVAADVATFQQVIPNRLDGWRRKIDAFAAAGRKIVLWGGGSKGVSFLTTLGVRDEIRYVVDINTAKAHTFMAGTGQEIVPPSFLADYRPDVVIVMNPIYVPEIRQELARMGLDPELGVPG